MADTSIGEIALTLDGKEVTLRCSLAAAKRVNAGGGYFHVMARLGAMDLDFYTMVVSAGLDKQPRDVENAVYLAGLPNLTQPLITFCEYLANGGKPVTPDTGDGKTGEA